jgi:predicted ABC-type transport system involved in lysophospholipase L1 biosynthesis ATPase subunit
VSVALSRRALAACRCVTVAYGRGAAQARALSDVDLAIHAGQRVGLTGRSGSGKTTLLHVLGGLVTPTRGEVLLGGELLQSLDFAARGRLRAGTVAYVFQGSNLLPCFTAFENVAFAEHVAGAQRRALDTPREGERGGSAPLDATELLALVGLRDKLDALPSELSGGEAQRVALARALAQRPDLLLCDEPTGQLDSDTGTRVLDQALHAELAFALVTATHDPDVAARAERIVTLDDGRIVSDEQVA